MDNNQFWQQVTDELAQLPLQLTLTPLAVEVTNGEAFSMQYQSLGGEIIHGLYLQPKSSQPTPVVIDFLGYLTQIENPQQFSHWLAIGCGCLVIDNRGQGGATLDQVPYQTVTMPMPLGRGLLTPEDSYLRRMVADQLRLFEVLENLPRLDASRVYLHGNSQGGGLALMVNSLSPVAIQGTFANVPSQSNLPHRIAAATGSYGVMKEYLNTHPTDQKQVLQTMAIFDIRHYAHLIENPVWASVATNDITCPMVDFFPTYKRLAGPKQLTVFWGKGHEGGGLKRLTQEIQLLKEIM